MARPDNIPRLENALLLGQQFTVTNGKTVSWQWRAVPVCWDWPFTWCTDQMLSFSAWHRWLGHLTRKKSFPIWPKPIMCLVGRWTLLTPVYQAVLFCSVLFEALTRDRDWIGADLPPLFWTWRINRKDLQRWASPGKTQLQQLLTDKNSLASGNYQRLHIPRNKLKFTDRAFSHAAPTIWDGLPTSVTSSSTLEHFKWSCKNELYSRAFDRNWFVTSCT